MSGPTVFEWLPETLISLAALGLSLISLNQSRKAAKSQKDYEELVSQRIRPVAMMDWIFLDEARHKCALIVRNVGLGVGIIRSIEIPWHGGGGHTRIPSHDDKSTMLTVWRNFVTEVDASGHQPGSRPPIRGELSIRRFNDTNRALAPGESLLLVDIDVSQHEVLCHELRRYPGLDVRFVSLDGATSSVHTQFAQMLREDREGDPAR